MVVTGLRSTSSASFTQNQDVVSLFSSSAFPAFCTNILSWFEFWFGHFLFYFMNYNFMYCVLLSTSCICLFYSLFAVYTCVLLKFQFVKKLIFESYPQPKVKY